MDAHQYNLKIRFQYSFFLSSWPGNILYVWFTLGWELGALDLMRPVPRCKSNAHFCHLVFLHLYCFSARGLCWTSTLPSANSFTVESINASKQTLSWGNSQSKDLIKRSRFVFPESSVHQPPYNQTELLFQPFISISWNRHLLSIVCCCSGSGCCKCLMRDCENFARSTLWMSCWVRLTLTQLDNWAKTKFLGEQSQKLTVFKWTFLWGCFFISYSITDYSC